MTAIQRFGQKPRRVLPPRCWCRRTCWLARSRSGSQPRRGSLAWTARPGRTATTMRVVSRTRCRNTKIRSWLRTPRCPSNTGPRRRSPRARMAAAVSVLVGLPEALLARTVRRGSVIHGGGRLVLALSTGAALLVGLIVITLGRGRGDTSRSIQNAPAIAALQQLQGTSFRIALQPAPRSSPHRTHHRASRKQPSSPRARSHVTVARRVTAVAARYTPQASAADQSTGTSAPVTGGSSTSGSHGSSAAASSTTKSSSSPTAADRAPTRPFGAGGALGPGSSPNG